MGAPILKDDQGQVEQEIDTAVKEDLAVPSHEELSEDHEKLRHNWQEGLTANGTNVSGASTDARQHEQLQQQTDLVTNQKKKRGRSKKGEGFTGLLQQVTLLLQEDGIDLEALVKDAIQDRSESTGLEISKEELCNIAREILSALRSSLANGDLVADEQLEDVLEEAVKQHVFQDENAAYIAQQIMLYSRAEGGDLAGAVTLYRERAQGSSELHALMEVCEVFGPQGRALFVEAYRQHTGEELEETLLTREQQIQAEKDKIFERLVKLQTAASPEQEAERFTLTTRHNRLVTLLAEVGITKQYLATGQIAEAQRETLFQRSLVSYAQREAALLAEHNVDQETLERLRASREAYLESWLGVGWREETENQPIEAFYREQLQSAQEQAVAFHLRALHHQIGVHESALHHNDAEQSKQSARYREMRERYIERQKPLIESSATLTTLATMQLEKTQQYKQALKVGQKIDTIVSLIQSEANAWFTEDEDKVMDHLRMIQSPEERKLVNDELMARCGRTLDDCVEDIFGGMLDYDSHLDMARDILNQDYVAAATAELEMELDEWWPDKADIKRILEIAEQDREYFDETYMARYGKSRQAQINQDRRGSYLGNTMLASSVVGTPLLAGRLLRSRVEIESVDDVLHYSLDGDVKMLATGIRENDPSMVYAAEFHGFFGFNDLEKQSCEYLERLVADEWEWREVDGEMIAILSEEGTQKLRQLALGMAKYDEPGFDGSAEEAQQHLEAFITSQLGAAERDWALALVKGDRLAADAATLRYAYEGAGTDEALSLGIIERRRQELGEAFLQYRSVLEDKYRTQCGRELTDDAAAEYSKYQQKFFDIHYSGEPIREEVYRLLKIRMAAGGMFDGTDEQTIHQYLADLDSEMIEKIKAADEELFGNTDFVADIEAEFSLLWSHKIGLMGDDLFDLRQNLKGKPTTLEEMAERIKARYDYECSGILDGEVFGLSLTYGYGLDDFPGGMSERYAEFEQKYEEYRELKETDPDKALAMERRLQSLYEQTLTQCNQYRALKNQVADTVTETATVAAVVIVCISSGGTGTPIAIALKTGLAAGKAALATRLTLHTLMKGQGYGGEEVGSDFVLAGVEGGTAIVGAAASGIIMKKLGELSLKSPMSRKLLAIIGSADEAKGGMLLAKETGESAAQQSGLGAQGLLYAAAEGAETEINGTLVQYTLNVSREAIDEALKSKNSYQQVMGLIEEHIVTEGLDEAARRQLIAAVQQEIETEWAQLAMKISEVGIQGIEDSSDFHGVVGKAHSYTRATGRRAVQFGRRATSGTIEGSIDGTVSAGAEGLIVTGFDYRTWQDGVGSGLLALGRNTILYGSTGFFIGAGLGGALSVTNRTARMSKVLDDAQVDKIIAGDMPSITASWRSARRDMMNRLRAMSNVLPERIRIPEKPNLHINERGVELIKARRAQHGKVTQGDFEDAILISHELTPKEVTRALKDLNKYKKDLQRENHLQRLQTKEEVATHKERVEKLTKSIDDFKASVDNGEPVTAYDYLSLLGDSNHYYYHVRRPQQDAEVQVQPETVAVSTRSTSESVAAPQEPTALGARDTAELELEVHHPETTEALSFEIPPRVQSPEQPQPSYKGDNEPIGEEAGRKLAQQLGLEPKPDTTADLYAQVDANIKEQAARLQRQYLDSRPIGEEAGRKLEQQLGLRPEPSESVYTPERVERIDEAIRQSQETAERIERMVRDAGVESPSPEIIPEATVTPTAENPEVAAINREIQEIQAKLPQYDNSPSAREMAEERILQLQEQRADLFEKMRRGDSEPDEEYLGDDWGPSDWGGGGGSDNGPGLFPGGGGSGGTAVAAAPPKQRPVAILDEAPSIFERSAVRNSLETESPLDIEPIEMMRPESSFGDEFQLEPRLQPAPEVKPEPKRVAVMDRPEVIPGFEDTARMLDEAAARYAAEPEIQNPIDTTIDTTTVTRTETAPLEEDFTARQFTQEPQVDTEQTTAVDVEATNALDVNQASEIEHVNEIARNRDLSPSNSLSPSPEQTRYREETASKKKKRSKSKTRHRRGYAPEEGEGEISRVDYDSEQQIKRYQPEDDKEVVKTQTYSDYGRWFLRKVKHFFGEMTIFRARHD